MMERSARLTPLMVLLVCVLPAPSHGASTRKSASRATALPSAVAAALAARAPLLPNATCSCTADCPVGRVCARPRPGELYASAPECVLPGEADIIAGVFEYGCGAEGVAANERREAAAAPLAGRAATAPEAAPDGGAPDGGATAAASDRTADGETDWAVRRRAAARRLLSTPLGPAGAPRS